MGRKPCYGKGVIRGPWFAKEDEILVNYIKIHSEGKWTDLPRRAGLRRCGKSCRLRWLNYLRPDIKRGNITEDEDGLIIRLHKLLGNRNILRRIMAFELFSDSYGMSTRILFSHDLSLLDVVSIGHHLL